MKDRSSASRARSVRVPVRWMLRQNLELFGVRSARRLDRRGRSASPGRVRSDAPRVERTRRRADPHTAERRRAKEPRLADSRSEPGRSAERRPRRDAGSAVVEGTAQQASARASRDATTAADKRHSGALSSAEAAKAARELQRHPREPASDDHGDEAVVEYRTGLADRIPESVLVATAIGGLLMFVLAFFGGTASLLSPIQAIILGAVEGVTEFLPVSSTGHLLVVERLMGLGTGAAKSATDTFTVAVQIGAIFAVVGVYRARIASMIAGVFGRNEQGRRLLLRLIVAFCPAAVVGFGLNDVIKTYLFGVWPVVVAWAVGGAVLLVWAPRPGAVTIDTITYRQALIIGSSQVLAMWPGTSRSLATIIAALALGLTMSAAVEFSFLLGLATLSAATILDLTQNGNELVDKFGLFTPMLGTVVAGVTASVAVKWFVAYLRTKPLTIFGWYRIGIAAVTAGLALAHII